jgi:hypothetical protein
MRRDGGHCQVPGCRCSLWVDIHHIRLRSEGGTHDLDQMVVVCAAHHRALHRGALLVEGSASKGLEFRHADGTCFGGPVHAEAAAACLQAQSALRSFGFGESESRLAVAQAREGAGDREVPGDLVRAALRVLRPRLGVCERRAVYRVGGVRLSPPLHTCASERWDDIFDSERGGPPEDLRENQLAA